MSTLGPDSGITIETKDLNLIKKVIGFPKVKNILLTDEQIVDFCIEEPLRKYFNKWPIEVEEQILIGDTPFVIPFPDDTTYGIKNVAIVGKYGTSDSSNSDFWALARFQQQYGTTLNGSYGAPGFNPNGLKQTQFDRLQQTATLENRLITQDYRVDRNNRQITIYVSTRARVDITWAKYSTEFNTVKFERKTDVIKFCQIELLRHLADTVDLLSDSDLTVAFNPDDLKAKATEMEDKLTEAWDSIPDVVYLGQN